MFIAQTQLELLCWGFGEFCKSTDLEVFPSETGAGVNRGALIANAPGKILLMRLVFLCLCGLSGSSHKYIIDLIPIQEARQEQPRTKQFCSSTAEKLELTLVVASKFNICP